MYFQPLRIQITLGLVGTLHQLLYGPGSKKANTLEPVNYPRVFGKGCQLLVGMKYCFGPFEGPNRKYLASA